MIIVLKYFTVTILTTFLSQSTTQRGKYNMYTLIAMAFLFDVILIFLTFGGDDV